MPHLFFISMPSASEWLIIGVVLLSFVLWITALVDIIRSRFDNNTTKIAWLLLVIFLGIIGALIYYFAGRQSKLSSDEVRH